MRRVDLFSSVESGMIVVPDIRFPNEDEFFRSRYDYKLVRVLNPRITNEVGIKGHASAIHSPTLPADFEIVNDSTINVFSARVAETLADFLKD